MALTRLPSHALLWMLASTHRWRGKGSLFSVSCLGNITQARGGWWLGSLALSSKFLFYLFVECAPVRCAPALSRRFESNSLIFLLIPGLIATCVHAFKKIKNQPLRTSLSMRGCGALTTLATFVTTRTSTHSELPRGAPICQPCRCNACVRVSKQSRSTKPSESFGAPQSP